MAHALGVLRGVSTHRSSGAVLISGQPGIGKSALLAEICQQAVTMGLRVASSKCDRNEQVWPGAPVLALLRASADPLASAQEYAQAAGLTAEPLLMADQIAALLESAAATGPLLMAVDDLQWADHASRFTLRMLLSRLIGLPVAWALASRDEDVLDDVIRHQPARSQAIQLTPLAAGDIADLAADRLGHPPDERALNLLSTANGSPFIATEMTDALIRSAARGETEAVPAEFTAAIAGQVAALAPEARDLVWLLAVAGRPLSIREVTALRPAAAAARGDLGVATAIDSGLIVASGGGLAFRHDLVVEAVYASMPAPHARTLHRALAGYYLATAEEPLLAAPHARAAAVSGDLACAGILVTAAESLATVSAGDAGDLAALAVRDIRPGQAGWLELSLRCLTVLCRVQRAAEATAVADRILASVDDANTIGQVEAEAARALWLGGRLAELMARTDRVLDNPDMAPGVSARLRSIRALAGTRLTTGDVAAKEAAAALEAARDSGDRDALTLALQAAGQACRNEARHDSALRHFREMRSVGGATGIAEEITELQFLDRFDHARTLLDQAVADTRDGNGTILPTIQFAQAWQDVMLARLDDADAGGRALIDLGRQVGSGLYTADGVIIRVTVALLRGENEIAAAHFRRAGSFIGADERIRTPALAVADGWVAASLGRLEQAVTVLRPVVDGALQLRSYWPLWPCWNGLFFEFATLAGDDPLTDATVDIAQSAATRNPGVASFEGVALNLRGRREHDLGIIARSAEVLARSPRPLLQALGAETYAEALLTAGQRSAALEQLDHAWDIYHRVGAGGLRARVQQAMREAGARYPKWGTATARSRSGWQSLTGAERRVAALIGDGHTNKSAAAELGVTINTVTTHLRAVFAKLGIQSRVQLAIALREEIGG